MLIAYANFARHGAANGICAAGLHNTSYAVALCREPRRPCIITHSSCAAPQFTACWCVWLLCQAQVDTSLSAEIATWFQTEVCESRRKLAWCFLRGCRHLGLCTTCPCENRFRFVKGEQMANWVGKRKDMISVLRALVEQGRQLAQTRLHKYSVDADLDRSEWEEFKNLPRQLAHGLTSYAAKMVAEQYKLAGAPGQDGGAGPAQGSAVGPTAASPPYQWQPVDPLQVSGVNAGDATQAWVLRSVGARRPRTRVVLLTQGGFARCTCPHHEHWGLPCRHVLFLFGAPTLEMCDHMWWHSTVFGQLDDWLWSTYYRKQARTPGVLVGSTLAAPLGGPPAITLDVPALTVTGTYVKAEWLSGSSDGGARDDTDGAAATSRAIGASRSSAEHSSKEGYGLFKEFIALASGPFEAAYAEGKQAELIQATNTYLAALQSFVHTESLTTGVTTDGRVVSIAGAARSGRGKNTSKVNASCYDPKQGTGNGRGKKSAKQSFSERSADGNTEGGTARPGSEGTRAAPGAGLLQRQYGVPTTRGACQGGDGLGGGVGAAQGEFINWEGSCGN